MFTLRKGVKVCLKFGVHKLTMFDLFPRVASPDHLVKLFAYTKEMYPFSLNNHTLTPSLRVSFSCKYR